MIHHARTKTAQPAAKPNLRLRTALDLETPELLDSDATSDFFSTEHAVDEQHNLELAQRILKRIAAQLPGRIRNLTVYTTENAVVLAGQCSTFYSKQLAQHAAMGVLEYEQLINNIEVRVAK